VGTLHDDGQNGDLIAGDGIYTLQLTLNEPAAEQIQFQVSSAFRGTLKRLRVSLAPVFIQPPDAPSQAITGLIGELQAGIIDAALKRFVPSQSTTDTLTNLSIGGRAALASSLATAKLVETAPDLRIFTADWAEPDGTTTPVEFWMIPNSSGQWIISNW
jgi:hypothetical protein